VRNGIQVSGMRTSGTRSRGAGTLSEAPRGIAFAQPLATVCEPSGFRFRECGD